MNTIEKCLGPSSNLVPHNTFYFLSIFLFTKVFVLNKKIWILSQNNFSLLYLHAFLLDHTIFWTHVACRHIFCVATKIWTAVSGSSPWQFDDKLHHPLTARCRSITASWSAPASCSPSSWSPGPPSPWTWRRWPPRTRAGNSHWRNFPRNTRPTWWWTSSSGIFPGNRGTFTRRWMGKGWSPTSQWLQVRISVN